MVVVVPDCGWMRFVLIPPMTLPVCKPNVLALRAPVTVTPLPDVFSMMDDVNKVPCKPMDDVMCSALMYKPVTFPYRLPKKA